MNNSVDSHARSMSIRAKANNLAKKTGISPQAALQAYFTERFLARLSRSEYASSMIIKGGTLMSSLLGIAERTTMDIDATLIGSPGNEAGIRSVVERIESPNPKSSNPPMAIGKPSGTKSEIENTVPTNSCGKSTESQKTQETAIFASLLYLSSRLSRPSHLSRCAA